MDLTVVLAIVSGFIILVLLTFVLRNRRGDEDQDAATPEERRPQTRNARARLRAAAMRQDDDAEEDMTGETEHEKIGAKKRAKLEAKAEKKAHREAEEREREERKKRKEQQEEERKKLDEKREEEEARQEEEERKAQEEKERREHEEYLKMKQAFSIEEEGYDEDEIDEEDLLKQFLDYIKNNKVIILEDLAVRFKLKTQAVIDRIKELQSSGQLTGVIDDRGKFIYISQSELEAVAKFVKQRGRVSIAELAESSQRLINLTPTAIQT